MAYLFLAFLACALALPQTPSFRFRYDENNAPVSQFYRGPDGSLVYSWGYNFPGRSHSETKNVQGSVSGRYEFVDANGAVQRTNYNADPVSGFIVEDSQPSPGAISEFAPVASRYTGLPFGQSVEDAVRRNSPQLLESIRNGDLVPVETTGGEVVFRVSNSLVDRNQGSISALAATLDTDLPAAKHDAQVYKVRHQFENPSPLRLSAFEYGQEYFKPLLETVGSANDVQFIVRVPLVTGVGSSAMITDFQI